MNKITKVILGAALVLVFIGAFSGAAAAVHPEEPGVIIIETTAAKAVDSALVAGNIATAENDDSVAVAANQTGTKLADLTAGVRPPWFHPPGSYVPGAHVIPVGFLCSITASLR